jgi:hypothetical protein
MRCPVGSWCGRRRFGIGGQIGERLGHGPGGDQLRAHFGHVTHTVLSAPVDELSDELVELRRAQDPGRDRPRQRRSLVGLLRRAVAGREPIDPDDRHHDDPLHAGTLADLLQIPRGRGEELGRRLLLGRTGARVAFFRWASSTEALPLFESSSPERLGPAPPDSNPRTRLCGV